MHFGDLLILKRHEAGLTQRQLCEKTGGVVSQASLSQYESGKARPAHKSLVSILDALGINGADRAVALHAWSTPLTSEEKCR